MDFDSFRQEGILKVVAGISGGADSMAMLNAYLQAGVRVIAVHCNFGLRGSESDRDEAFVKMECERLGVRLMIYRPDVKEYKSTRNVSTEMACRELRYARFREIKTDVNADRIAVAHNADDNIETLFLNLMRGSGIAGLRCMLPDTGEIVRPLLSVSRKEILAYLETIGQEYVIDSTNLGIDFRRNFIRNKVLPLLEEEWPQVRKSVSKTIVNLRGDDEALRLFYEGMFSEEGRRLDYDRLRNFPNPEWLIFKFISRFGGSGTQAAEIWKAVSSENFMSGKLWIVDRGKIVAERKFLEFSGDCETSTEVFCSNYKVGPEILQKIRKAPLSELWTVLPPERLLFRHPEKGDRISPLGMKGSVAVSKIMKDAKLSNAEKSRVIIAQSKTDGKIIWVGGLKRSGNHLVEPDSETAYRYLPTLPKYDNQ